MPPVASTTEVRRWLEHIDDLVGVSCGDRENLVVVAEDVSQLRKKPPSESKAWPPRLLPLWESMLMGHADKSWTVPKESERKEIWRKSAMVVSLRFTPHRKTPIHHRLGNP